MRKFVFLCSALLAVMLMVLMGCDQESPIGVDNQDPEVRLSYPNYCFSLNVPFIVQFPPGDKDHTKNCGQACCVMLGGYFNNGAVASWVITEENNWLANTKNDNRYRDPNGWYTSRGDLQNLLWSFHRLNSTIYFGSAPDDVINEVVNNRRPTIVGVMIKDGKLVSSGGAEHWALCVGWNGKVILHDPGTIYGKYIAYPKEEFDKSWATQRRVYIPVYR